MLDLQAKRFVFTMQFNNISNMDKNLFSEDKVLNFCKYAISPVIILFCMRGSFIFNPFFI